MSHLKILKCFPIKNIVIWLGMSLSFTPGVYSQQKSMLIWFDTPAYQPKVFTYETPEFKKQFHFENKGWNEAFPVGNSRMGQWFLAAFLKNEYSLTRKVFGMDIATMMQILWLLGFAGDSKINV